MEEINEFAEYSFPWLVFKLNNNSFAVNSETITSITIMPDRITSVPQVPDYIRGLLNLRGTVIPLLDMRALFGMPSLQKECDDFAEMIDIRIQDHLDWVKDLEYCAKNNEEFTRTTNPHKCAFGMWYDQYKSDNNLVNFHLRKIDEPHQKLHHVGDELKEAQLEPDKEKRQRMIDNMLVTLNKQLVPQLVSLLNETKNVLRESYREMVVVLENDKQKIGLIVDEVQSVEKLSCLCNDKEMDSVCDSKFIKAVGKSTKTNNMILLVDEDLIRNAFKPADYDAINASAQTVEA